MEIYQGIRNLWQWDAFQHAVVLGVILHQCTKVALTRPRMISWGFFILVCLTDTLAYLNIYVRSIWTDSLLNMWAPYLKTVT